MAALPPHAVYHFQPPVTSCRDSGAWSPQGQVPAIHLSSLSPPPALAAQPSLSIAHTTLSYPAGSIASTTPATPQPHPPQPPARVRLALVLADPTLPPAEAFRAGSRLERRRPRGSLVSRFRAPTPEPRPKRPAARGARLDHELPHPPPLPRPTPGRAIGLCSGWRLQRLSLDRMNDIGYKSRK